MYRDLRLGALLLCVIICISIQFSEAGKVKKVVKEVAKNAILPGRRHGRGFPIWGIILLVVLLTGVVGGGLFLLFCFFQRRRSQTQSFI